MEEWADEIVDQLGLSWEQAIGAAGLLLEFAQDELTRNQFKKVAHVIPAISDVIGKAPRDGIANVHPVWTTLSRWFGGLGNLQCVLPGFEKLQLQKQHVTRLTDMLATYFGKHGGAEVEHLLRSVWR